MNIADCLRYIAACFYVFRSFDMARMFRSMAMAWDAPSSRDEQDLAIERVRAILARHAALPAEQTRGKTAKRSFDLCRKALLVMVPTVICEPTPPSASDTLDDMASPRPPRRAGNPDGSEWRSTPAAKRGRKLAGFTLDDATRAEIELQANEHHDGNKSAAVEAAIWAAAPPERRPAKP